jgi:hypothetical protein
MQRFEEYLKRPYVKLGYLAAVIAVSCTAFYPIVQNNLYHKEKKKYDALIGARQGVQDQELLVNLLLGVILICVCEKLIDMENVPKDYEMVKIAKITEDEIGDYRSAVKEYELQKKGGKKI